MTNAFNYYALVLARVVAGDLTGSIAITGSSRMLTRSYSARLEGCPSSGRTAAYSVLLANLSVKSSSHKHKPPSPPTRVDFIDLLFLLGPGRFDVGFSAMHTPSFSQFIKNSCRLDYVQSSLLLPCRPFSTRLRRRSVRALLGEKGPSD